MPQGVSGFTGTHFRPKALVLQRVPGSAAKRMAPREATGRDLNPAVTEVAERTGALITIRPRSTGPCALLQTPAPGECFVDSRQRSRAPDASTLTQHYGRKFTESRFISPPWFFSLTNRMNRS